MTLESELAKNICKNIGATPISIGKAGLTHSDLFTKEYLKISYDSLVKEIPLYYGEISSDDTITCILLTWIESESSLEVIFSLGFKLKDTEEFDKDSPIIGFRYDWGNENEDFVIKRDDKMMKMDLIQKLNMALSFEIMMQEGYIFNNGSYSLEQKRVLVDLISVE